MTDDHEKIKARLKAILNGPEAKGRTELAEYLAYETDYSTKVCIGILNAAHRGEVPRHKAPEPAKKPEAASVKQNETPKWVSKFFVR